MTGRFLRLGAVPWTVAFAAPLVVLLPSFVEPLQTAAVGIDEADSTGEIESAKASSSTDRDLVGVATVASGDEDYAMNLASASSQYATAPDNSGFDITGAITVEAWVKPTNICSSTACMVVNKEFAYELYIYNGTWHYALNGASSGQNWIGIDTGIVPQADQWQHLAMTRAANADVVNFYVDGQLAYTGAADGAGSGTITDSTHPFTVGGRSNHWIPYVYTQFFPGSIDEVRVFSDVRTDAEILDDMHNYGPTNTDNLVIYYDFNEGPAGTTGSGTVYNRASGATSATNLRTVASPTYVDVKQTTINGNNTVVAFPRSYLTAAGGWRVPDGVTAAETLVVAGGGGGGDAVDLSGWQGGGGGAGGYVTAAATSFAAGSVAEVTVGMGGRAGTLGSGVANMPTNGQDSVLGATSTITAVGGGVGGQNTHGGDGGSGGGGGMYSGDGGVASPSQGNAGGSGAGASNYAAGGGGGSGGAGTNGTGTGTGAVGGSGGAGTANDISGSSQYYAAGGNAAGCAADGTASGSGQTAVGTDGRANTGSGGGGGSNSTTQGACTAPSVQSAGAGGSGVVIVSYSTTNTSCEPFESSYIDDGAVYRVLKWSDPSHTNCTWTVPAGVSAFDYLVVGGGGAGGSAGGHTSSGGGGGGRVIEGSVSAAGSSYSVTVGSGGSPVSVPNSSDSHGPGGDGEASSLGSISAAGGGGGASAWRGPGEQGPASSTGWTGGGGAAHATSTSPGTTGTGGAGYKGGDPHGATTADPQAGGGGGGAGGPGDNATADIGGNGGAGVESAITGTVISYAGGGGGGKRIGSSGSAGLGVAGGGNGGLGTSGTAGTRGGGGGGSGDRELAGFLGGAGGDGVVIVRYEVSQADSCTPFEYSYVDETTTPGTSYTVVEFQGAGTCNWTVPSGVASVDVLAVGGGGGGGAWVGGGGGGGGVTATSGLGVTAGSSMSITVGAGGSGADLLSNHSFTAGANGGSSSFGSSVSALGGGVGASWPSAQSAGTGSGIVATGGGGSGSGYYLGGTGTSGQGFDGGDGYNPAVQPHATGGGGGAGGVGGDQSGNSVAGSGGTGLASSITGASVYYGGGGGGGTHGTYSGSTLTASGIPGLGGHGGGGAGVAPVDYNSAQVGFSGTNGLGGGGGGAGGRNSSDGTSGVRSTGGDGGDGVVIVRYYTNWLSTSAGDAQQPSDYTYSPASASWDSAAPKVQVIDSGGNAQSTSGVSVVASFNATSGSATLSNETATTDANGVADFSSLILDGDAGTSGTLTFTATGYGTVTSTSVTIGKATPTLSWSDVSKTYGDASYTISAPTASVAGSFGYSSSDSSVVSVSGSTATVAGVGSATVTATFTPTDTTNYVSGETVLQTVTVAKGSQSTLTVTSTSGTYGTAITLATSGGSSGGSVTYVVADGTASGCSESSGLLTSSSAGTCTVTATMAGNTSYNSVSSSPTDVTVDAKALTVTGVTASNKVYDGTTSATLDFTSAALVGVVSGDSSTEIAIDSSGASGTFASAEVASGVSVTVTGVALSGTKAASYTVAQPTGITADIASASRSLDFSATSYSKTYGDATFSVTASPSVGAGTVTYSVTGSACTVNTSSGVVAIVGAGSCSISAAVASDGTYDGASTTTPASVTVAKVPLTVTASSHSVTYGDAVPSVTPTYSGFITGESAADLTTAPTCSTVYTTSSSAATTPLTTCSGGVADNYSLIYVSGSVTIAQDSRTITFTAPSPATYGDDPFTILASLDGRDDDVVTFASTTPLVCSVAGDASTVGGATTGVVTVVGAGTCSITASRTATVNYTASTDVAHSVSVAKRAQTTLTFTNADTFTWGDSMTLAATSGLGTGTVSFGTTGGTAACTVNSSTGVVTIGRAGTCNVTAQRAGDTNHLVGTTVTQTITIGRAAQTVTFTSAVPATPLPNGTYTPTATATSGLDPVISITAGDGTVCSATAGVVTFLASGVCTLAADQAGNVNYTAASRQSQTITVGALNQSITVSTPDDIDIGAAAVTLDAAATSGLVVTVTSADTDVCSVNALVVTAVAVGTCTLDLTQPGDDRYAAATTTQISFDVNPVVPSAPYITSVSGGDAAITVAFTAPVSTGGIDLAAYRVIVTPDGGTPILNDTCTASPCTVDALVNGTVHTVVVTARNSVGLGPVSNTSPEVTPATAATAVRSLSATPLNGGLTVSWTPPSVFGGGTFSAYELRVREVGGIWPAAATATETSSTATQRVLSGLANGTAYEVQVVTITTANGSALVGNTAELTSVPVTVPGEPGAIVANRTTPRTAELSWPAPTTDGGATVTGYTVTVSDDDGDAVTCASVAVSAVTRAGSCTLSDLELGTGHTIEVAAVNRVGTGASATATYTTPAFPAPEQEPVVSPDAGCPPCVLDTDGNPVPHDTETTGVGAQPGIAVTTVGDATITVTASWLDADAVAVVQLPDTAVASGTGALATSTVVAYLGGERVGTAVVDADGRWSIDLVITTDGTLVVSVVTTTGDELVVTYPLDVVDTTDASEPRVPTGGEQVLPGPGDTMVFGPNGERLDADVTSTADGGVLVVIGGISVRVTPTAETRTVVDAIGRLIVFDDARMRVNGTGLLGGSSIVLFSDDQRLAAVTVADDTTVDTTVTLTEPDVSGERVLQIDVIGADTVGRSIAIGYLHVAALATKSASPADDAVCAPCASGPGGTPVIVDVGGTPTGELPGSLSMGDDVSSVTIGSADGTVGPGEATVWMSAQEVLTAQTPGTLPVSGTGALPTTDVTLHVNGVEAGTVTVGIDGAWNRQLALPAGTDGFTRIMVGYTDANGDERVITIDIDVIAGGADATGPRRPASGTVLTPGAGNAQAIAADGTLLDATYAIGITGVAVTVGDTTVGVEPDAVRGTVTTDGRLVVVLPAQVRVTAQGMLPGATATVWVMSDPQLLGTVRVAANGTIDTVFDLPNSLASGEHTVQIDSVTSTGERISVAVGMEVTQGSLPATGVHADLVLAWAVLIVAIGALMTLSGSGRRRPHTM